MTPQLDWELYLHLHFSYCWILFHLRSCLSMFNVILQEVAEAAKNKYMKVFQKK